MTQLFPYESPFWRFVVTDNNTLPITLLDRLASNRSASFLLNHPAQTDGYVPSDSPEINILHTDGYPFLAEGVRLLYGFRQEFDNLAPVDPTTEWVCRFAGRIELVEDDTRTEDAQTHYTAYDPWRYWHDLILYTDSDGTEFLNGAAGTLLTGRADEIAVYLMNGYACPNDWTFVNPGGTIEVCATLPDGLWIPQGTSLGEALTMLTSTGLIDIVLEPVYDPVTYGGTLCLYNIYVKAGVDNPSAVFAWDMPSRSLVGISDLQDGTQRANNIIVHAGQGGKVVYGTQLGLMVDTASEITYGRYYSESFESGQNSTFAEAQLYNLAAAELELRKNGKTTVTCHPAPERSPSPFTDYWLGDRVPIYASNNLRLAVNGVSRVYGVELSMSNDALETVEQLLTVADVASPPVAAAEGGTGTAGSNVAVIDAGGVLARNTRRSTTPFQTRPFRSGRLGV